MKCCSKWIAGLLVFVMLLGATACREGKSGYGSGIEGALAAVEAGDHQAAYELLKEDDSVQAKEMLKKFVFVPITWNFTEDGELMEKKQYTYDKDGRVVTVVRDDRSREKITTTTYEYDGQGYLTAAKQQKSDGKAETVTYTVTNNGRQITENDAGSYRTYLCDANGRLIEERTENSVTLYAYDEAGRLISEAEEYQTRYYAYDEQGRRSSLKRIRDGETTVRNYSYIEENGMVAMIEDGDTSDKNYFSWDENGNIVMWRSSNEVYTWAWMVFYYPDGIPFATLMELNEVLDIKY